MPGAEKEYTIAALVQANCGAMRDFRVAGAPIGRLIYEEQEREMRKNPDDPELMAQAKIIVRLVEAKKKMDGSIIVVLMTDAPLHPLQLQRLAKGATVGLARVGGQGHNPSGDIFLAFSTASEISVQSATVQAQKVDPWKPATLQIEYVNDQTINTLFGAVADVVESISNVLCMAETMTGREGRTVETLNLKNVKGMMQKYL